MRTQLNAKHRNNRETWQGEKQHKTKAANPHERRWLWYKSPQAPGAESEIKRGAPVAPW